MSRLSAPIIDVHLHAYTPQSYQDEVRINPITKEMPASKTSEEHMRATIDAMDEHNIVLGFISGPLEAVKQWKEVAPTRLVGGVFFGRASQISLEEHRALLEDGSLGMLGEISAQYEGLSASDPQLYPYYSMAEELDIPVCIHSGTSAPRIAQSGASPNFRLRYGNPFHLEDLLVDHPKLRVFMCHAGWPFITETLEMLRMYPDLYVDISADSWIFPREAWLRYLKALMDGGYGTRLLFGSDQMLWPEAVAMSIEGVESVDFLTEDQKRDIFYNNAVRFFRLEDELPKG